MMSMVIRSVVLLFLLAGLAPAQPSSIKVNYQVSTHRALELTFASTVPDPQHRPQVLHVFLVGPSGKREITAGLAATPLSDENHHLVFDVRENDATTPKDETQVEVILTNPDADITGPIITPADAKKTLADLQASLAKQVASEKSTDDKNLFAGLAVTVPSGKGDAQGSGDLVFNHQFFANQVLNGALFDNANLGLVLKKSSAAGADSRHFTAGMTMEKTFLFHRAEYKEVQKAIASNNPGDAQAALEKMPHHFWPSVFFDNGVSFEGDVRSTNIGNVSNFVFNSQVKLASATKALGHTGFFFIRIIPVGIEAGYNLKNQDAPALDGRSLARLKFGGTLTLRYDSQNNAGLNRVDLELNAVDRHLFSREVALDPTTKLVTMLTNGEKYYAEGNLKFYFSKVGKGRPGFRMSFKRGFLPPAFAFTKAFDAGFFYESADDKTANK
ncbi:MAG TPA: hypothetical protein VJ723_07565 [Candidatus Angelobacter sp.]|nr:hypothetical protein [Candidatus Angelobacter sp.]